MKKRITRTRLAKLPDALRAELRQWLLVEKAEYRDILKRLAERRVESSLGSLTNYHRKLREAEARSVGLAEVATITTVLRADGVDVDPDALCRAILASARKTLCEQLLQEPDLPTYSVLTREMLERDRLKVQEGELALKKDRFEFDAAAAALAELAALNVINNQNTNQTEKLNAVRRKLFGEAAK